MPRIIVERSFEPPMTEEELAATEARMAPCLDLYDVRWIRSYWSADRRRMICEYEAADVGERAQRPARGGGQVRPSLAHRRSWGRGRAGDLTVPQWLIRRAEINCRRALCALQHEFMLQCTQGQRGARRFQVPGRRDPRQFGAPAERSRLIIRPPPLSKLKRH